MEYFPTYCIALWEIFFKVAFLGDSINIKERQYSVIGNEIGLIARSHCAPLRA